MEQAGVQLVAEGADAFSRAMADAGKAVTGFGGVIGNAAGAVAGFTVAAGAAAAVGIGAGLAAAAKTGFEFNNSVEQATAKINAFTKDAAVTADILDMVRERAAKTPFEFDAMANAAAGLGPAAKSAGVPLEQLLETAEILAASNPAEGLEGAAFALREAASGDFTSVIERFNLSRQTINALKEEGVPNLEIVSRALQEAGYDYDLVSALAATASGRFSTFKDTFTNLAGTVTQPLFDAFSSSLGEVNDILAANSPLLEGVASSIGTALIPVAQWLGDVMVGAAQGLVTFVEGAQALYGLLSTDTSVEDAATDFMVLSGILGAEGAANLVNGIQTIQGAFAALQDGFAAFLALPIVDAVLNLFGAIADAGPLSIEAGEAFGYLQEQVGIFAEQAALALATWAQEAIPPMLANLQSAGQSLLAWAQEQAPGWLASLAALGQALGQWVVEAVPPMLGALLDARNALIQWVLDSLPGWASQLDNLRTAMIDWVAAALPDLGTNLGKVAALLLEKTGEFIAVAGPKLLELAGLFVSWVFTEALPRLPGELAKIGTALVTAVGNFIAEVWPVIVKLADQFTNWVQTEVLPKAPGELAKIGSAIVKGIQDFIGNVASIAAEVGQSIIDGMVNAISNGIGSVISAAREMAQWALDAAMDIIKPGSPSKVFTALGETIPQGLAKGILEMIGEATAAAATLAEEVQAEVLGRLEQMAEQARSILDGILAGGISFGRGQISAIDAIEDIQDRTAKMAEQANQANDKLADAEAKRLDQQRKAAQDIADLEAERAALQQTAAQNVDPAKRLEAARKLAEVDRKIADVQAKAAADERKAQADIARLREAQAKAAAQANAAMASGGPAIQSILDAQKRAEELAATDPEAAADFLALRLRQIREEQALQERLAGTMAEGERAVIQERLDTLRRVQALELEQLGREQQERARELRGLADAAKETGDQAADELLRAITEAMGAGGSQIADALLGAISRALGGGLVSAPASLAGVSSASYSTYGDTSLTINGAGFSLNQLRDVVRSVLAEQATSANLRGRMA